MHARLAIPLLAALWCASVAARAEEPAPPPDAVSPDAAAPADEAAEALAQAGPDAQAESEAEPEVDRVAEVRIGGNRRIESSAILPLLAQKPGEPLDREKVREDIRTLWAQKFFQDVQVDVTAGARGPIVTYVVTEKPLVRELRLTGHTEIEEEDLRKEFDAKPFQILDNEAVRRTVKKLEAKYADKGFFLAEVTSRIVPAPGDNQVDVIFDVVEHAKVEVRRIAFLGNKALTDEEIKAVLGTQEGSLLSFLTSQGTYKEEVFQRDLLVIQSLYYNKGYINVRVGRPAISLSPDKRFIFVTIPVEEGDPYDYGEITVGGELLGEADAVRRLVTLRKGERFASQELQKNMLALQDFFRDRGYAYVQVSPQTGVDVATRTVDLKFQVQPGAQVKIERIELVGNSKTHDLVIRRELRVSEGDTYNGTAIRTSKGRVTALGYFEAVDIASRQGSAPDTMVLEVSVKEKATGTFQVGLGFSNNEPLLLNANISQNNFLGWGYSVALMAQVSNLRRIFSLSFTNPFLLDTDWTVAFDFYRTLQVYTTFDRLAFGGTITFGYQIFEDFRFFGTLTSQRVDVTPSSSSDGVVLAGLYKSGWTNSLKGSFNYDKRDNRLFPSKGYLLSGAAEFAPGLGLFEEENVFQRYTSIARGYLPIWKGIVAKVNLTFGYIRSPDGQPPVGERFFEGGINSLRGYNFRTISPRVRAGGDTIGGPLKQVLVGGNKEFLSNWEVEFPILEEAGLRGVVFFDAGNVYAPGQSFFTESGPDDPAKLGLLLSVGAGARWFTPLGPLRFELGFPLTRRPEDDSYRFEFTIGNFF